MNGTGAPGIIISVPRRVVAHVMFNYDAPLQRAIWRRLWLASRFNGYRSAALFSMMVGFILSPLVGAVLDPANWYAQVAAFMVLFAAFGRSVMLMNRAGLIRGLLERMPEERPGMWNDVDEALIRTRRQVQPDDPVASVTVHPERGDPP